MGRLEQGMTFFWNPKEKKGDAMKSRIARRLGHRRACAVFPLLVTVLATAAITVAGAQAHSAVAPQSTSPPRISGRLEQGQPQTASNGSWVGSPTGFAYQWQQCDGSGGNCNSISGAT